MSLLGFSVLGHELTLSDFQSSLDKSIGLCHHVIITMSSSLSYHWGYRAVAPFKMLEGIVQSLDKSISLCHRQPGRARHSAQLSSSGVPSIICVHHDLNSRDPPLVCFHSLSLSKVHGERERGVMSLRGWEIDYVVVNAKEELCGVKGCHRIPVSVLELIDRVLPFAVSTTVSEPHLGENLLARLGRPNHQADANLDKVIT